MDGYALYYFAFFPVKTTTGWVWLRWYRIVYDSYDEPMPGCPVVGKRLAVEKVD